jgi:hypothetical protein
MVLCATAASGTSDRRVTLATQLRNPSENRE